jgi:hypothetical protein
MANTAARYRQRPLHEGYRYQDLVAALTMAAVLSDGRGEVAIEEARFQGDPFDDVVHVLDGRFCRLQVKHRTSGSLAPGTLQADSDGLRLDKLAESFDPVRDRETELRLVTTWPCELSNMCVARPESAPFAAGILSTRCGLDPQVLWPIDEEPLWEVLKNANREGKLSRDAFVAFCAAFIVEIDTPRMSGTLGAPGPLESLLLARLREDVGVEQFPNRREAGDAASRLLEVAGSMRNRGQRRITFAQIAHECGLRVDRGRVPQAFPLERERYVAGVPLRRELDAALQHHQRIVIDGPPGAGKSWVLEALSTDLRDSGWIVARHYCFLEPGDPDVGARIAVEAMTGSLIGGLLDDPRLTEVHPGLAGDLGSLERALIDAAECLAAQADGPEGQVRIALIVDGLDHVSRVDPVPGAGRVSPGDLAQSLAVLQLPERVTLIVASQPGSHLQPILDRSAYPVHAPPFALRDTAGLLARQGVFRALRSHGLGEDHRRTLDVVHEQAAGNPLYATFLGREVQRALGEQLATLPSQLIGGLPGAAGNLDEYYRHLISTLDHAPDNGVIAEHLAVVSFAVNVDELGQILPFMGRRRIESALEYLRPILHESMTQGGWRIYHESFRRFVLARLASEGRPLRSLLDPAIAWLERRGFFGDDRAFRYVLPLLRRAGRDEELLQRVSVDFVAASIVQLQPHAAVDLNLRLAADVAAERSDFVALVRIAELSTGAQVAYEEKLSDPTDWASAVIDLEGGRRMAERLLFEGRPTWQRERGMRLCALIDDAGVTPPWSEFLAMDEAPSNVARMHEEDERYSLDELHGRLRTSDANQTVPHIAVWLNEEPDATPTYLAGLADLIVRVYGSEALSQLIAEADRTCKHTQCWLQARLAREFAAAGRDKDAEGAAQLALEGGLPPTHIRPLLDCGIAASLLVEACPEPMSLVEAVLRERGPDADAVGAFFSALMTAAAAGSALTEVRAAIAGEGFYRAWLRYCCDVAEANVGQGDVLSALDELARDTRPFVGTPRACDLYSIQSLCRESFSRAAGLVGRPDWPRALDALLRIARGTTTYLQGTPSGPLPLWALLEIVRPYAEVLPLTVLLEEPERHWRSEFYDLHAETALSLGRLQRRCGQEAAAADALRQAGRYLASYGMHKDTTVFGLVHALEALDDPQDRAGVTARFVRLQPLCDRALRHSDGKETRHAPSAWLDAFSKHSPGAAARCLARTILEDPPVSDWRNERALRTTMNHAHGRIPPLLAHVLWRCTPRASPRAWLETIEALAAVDTARAHEALLELAAAIDGDSEHPDPHGAAIVTTWAEAREWAVPAMNQVADTREPSSSQPELPDHEKSPPNIGPFFDGAHTPLEVLIRLRERQLDTYERPLDAKAFSDELIERLEPLQEQDSRTCVGLLEDFCHEQRFMRSRGAVALRIAEAFANEEPSIVAELFALAWTAADEGWEPFGGLPHVELLRRAFDYDPEMALSRLAREFAWLIGKGGYVVGLTQRASELLTVASRGEDALAVWDAAYEVIEYRLPATGAERLLFHLAASEFDTGETPRAFAELLGSLIHHPDYERRAAAIAGIAEIMANHPDLAAASIETTLRYDATFTDTLLAMRLLEIADPAPRSVSQALEDWLPPMCRAQGFGLAHSAQELLGRLGQPTEARSAISGPVHRTVTEQEIEEALKWDGERRIHVLGRLWRIFPRKIAERYWSLWDVAPSHFGEIVRSQVETQFSRLAEWLGAWPLHRWESELLEIALHDSIDELVGTLIVSGRWQPGRDRWLHEFLSADVAAAVARARSRELRPGGVGLPAERASGSAPPQYRGEAPYAGWLRVALWEDEYRPRDRWRSGDYVRVRSGLWRGPMGQEDDAVDAGIHNPWALTSGDFQWHRQRPGDGHAWPPQGPLAAWSPDHDLVAFDQLLTVVPAVLEHLRLRPAEVPASFDLLDEAGALAAVCRQWRMRPYSYDYHPELPLIRGAELLLRADLAEALVGLDGVQEVTVVEIERRNA